MYVNSDAANNSSGNSTVSEADKILFDYIASIVKLLGGDATKYAHDIKGIVLVEKNLARIRTEPAGKYIMDQNYFLKIYIFNFFENEDLEIMQSSFSSET